MKNNLEKENKVAIIKNLSVLCILTVQLILRLKEKNLNTAYKPNFFCANDSIDLQSCVPWLMIWIPQGDVTAIISATAWE